MRAIPMAVNIDLLIAINDKKKFVHPAPIAATKTCALTVSTTAVKELAARIPPPEICEASAILTQWA